MDAPSSSSPSSTPLDIEMSEAIPYFPLLDGRIRIYLKQILQKLNPVALSTVRESSPAVNRLLMEEALRRNFVAEGKFEDHMKQDVVPIRGYPKYIAQRLFMQSEMYFDQDRIQISRRPAPFTSTSLLFHKSHPDCSCSRTSYDFWRNHIQSISAATAMSHLSGAKINGAVVKNIHNAEALIDVVSPYRISIVCLHVINCSRTAIYLMIDHFRPTVLTLDVGDSQEDYQKNEEIALDQIERGRMSHMCFLSNEYPARIVEHFLKLQSETLRRLHVEFPPGKTPSQHLVIFGMTWFTLKESYENIDDGINFERTVLLRSASSPPRHVLFVFGNYAINSPTVCRLIYHCVDDADDLLTRIFGSSYDPDEVYPSISDFSPSHIRSIFDNPNWPV